MKYDAFLNKWNIEGQDFEKCFGKIPKTREYTFEKVFEMFRSNNGKIIVELGTLRSFVHGGHVGCNLSDLKFWNEKCPENWDWGGGFFSRVAVEELENLSPKIYTVDIISSHIDRCKIITEKYKKYFTYVVSSSLDFLRSFQGKIDLLYLDTGDMWPIEPTANLQLEECKIIVNRNLLSDNGILLIDDVMNTTPQKFGETSKLGKSKYSIDYLLNNKYKILVDEYQYILTKQI
jgi:hypothetical protein